MRERYPTDLTDAEWEIVQRYVPEAVWLPNLQEPKYSRRDIVDAILYRERTGCQWRNLPHDFPPWKQVFEYYRKWRDDGTIEALHDALRERVRQKTPHADGSKRSDAPTVCIVDSQSAKTSEEGEKERGYDAGKKVKGRKRHLVVDALGLLLVLHVTSASVQDRDAALAMVQESKREFPSLKVVFMDGAYRGEVKSSIEETTGMQVKITLRSDPQKKALSLYPCDGSSNEHLDG
jgi:putative transposase